MSTAWILWLLDKLIWLCSKITFWLWGRWRKNKEQQQPEAETVRDVPSVDPGAAVAWLVNCSLGPREVMVLVMDQSKRRNAQFDSLQIDRLDARDFVKDRIGAKGALAQTRGGSGWYLFDFESDTLAKGARDRILELLRGGPVDVIATYPPSAELRRARTPWHGSVVIGDHNTRRFDLVASGQDVEYYGRP